ncbi:imidazoleglycerol-phosphate dehydratase HisB [Verrucomicrobium sp. BvORR106]|uniref:imidazoleglycerol-phosphate dehydratase HisB n=1 Tax=Verrucomicrobium sp. BvORR106 TaxID=1403819 RepID=UPI00056DF45B|nr:imidazoleglycerol-phosphate dehydratase HisB [Verrucomicrobium sp. BvORR106]
MSASRTSQQHRKTAETDIRLTLNVDGSGTSSIKTGIPFLDHMLTLFAKHGLFDLTVDAVGDIEVDFHHTVEDTGIVLGNAFREALGDKKGITRYGWCLLPMDETLAQVATDLSGRPFLVFRAPERVDTIGIGFHFQLVEEFMRGFSSALLSNLHMEIQYGKDAHHMAEALFKGLARAMDQATRHDPRVTGVPSTKEML